MLEISLIISIVIVIAAIARWLVLDSRRDRELLDDLKKRKS